MWWGRNAVGVCSCWSSDVARCPLSVHVAVCLVWSRRSTQQQHLPAGDCSTWCSQPHWTGAGLCHSWQGCICHRIIQSNADLIYTVYTSAAAHSALRLAVDTRAGGKPDIRLEWKRHVDDPAERGCSRSRTTLGSTPTMPGGSHMTASLGGRYDPWLVKHSSEWVSAWIPSRSVSDLWWLSGGWGKIDVWRANYDYNLSVKMDLGREIMTLLIIANSQRHTHRQLAGSSQHCCL